MACFFEASSSRVSPALSEAAQAWLLNEAAYSLRALGRLSAGVEPMRAAVDWAESNEKWRQAAVGAGNLGGLRLALGDLDAAARDAGEAVAFDDRSGDSGQRTFARAVLADSLHQAGSRDEAATLFREAEAVQAARQPPYPLLDSAQGFRYCDLLLPGSQRAAGLGREIAGGSEACHEVERRAAQTLAWAEHERLGLLDIALDFLTIGKAQLYRAILEGTALDDTHAAIEKAVDGLRRAADL